MDKDTTPEERPSKVDDTIEKLSEIFGDAFSLEDFYVVDAKNPEDAERQWGEFGEAFRRALEEE